MIRRNLSRLGCTLLCASIIGCSAATDASVVSATSAPALQQGALTDFVPAAGLRWLIAGSPAQLAREPALLGLQERWLTAERRQAFADDTGVDLLATRRALAAGFDLGALYLADASGWIAPPEQRFVQRLAGTERSYQPHPEIWRVSGVVGEQPQTLVRVARDLVALADGDPALARIVELHALGRGRRIPSAFDGAALSALPEALRKERALAC